jgi:hypothetical protein
MGVLKDKDIVKKLDIDPQKCVSKEVGKVEISIPLAKGDLESDASKKALKDFLTEFFTGK